MSTIVAELADLLLLAVLPGVLVVLVRRELRLARQMIEAKRVLAMLAGKLPSVSGLLMRFDTADRFPGGHCKPPVLVLEVAYL
jgi:hypothetical protein